MHYHIIQTTQETAQQGFAASITCTDLQVRLYSEDHRSHDASL